MSDISTLDETQCSLGEGPLWHPERETLVWFDINAHRLYAHHDGMTTVHAFDDFVSAAGRVDDARLVIAKRGGLILFDLDTGAREPLCPLEPDNPVTRPNDGRADPQGGFWIGTMGIEAEPGAGAIYRYHRGELRRLFAPISIPNAICFAPSGDIAYFTDTPTGRIMRQRLDGDGWPRGEPEVFLDLPADTYRPDGAVVDAAGNLWCAHYGHGKITVHGPDGTERRSIALPARQTTCPAFGGPGLDRLFVTSAAQNLTDPAPDDGRTLMLEPGVVGQAEHKVIP